MSEEDDRRLDAIVDLIVELASGNLRARLEPSPARDAIDAVITGINLLADELYDVYAALEARVAERTSALVTAQNDLRQLALKDPLTGLANRTLLGDRIQQAIARADHGGLPPAVLLLDLDGFKAINDSLGHAAGDAALMEVAQRLRLVSRAIDTVARLGGDEFALLMPDATDDEALRVAQAALSALAQPVALAARSVWTSASIGLRFGQRGQGAELLLRDADTAMYAAKANGRSNIQIFRPAMHFAVQQRLQLASDLSNALSLHQLVLRYQPVVNLADGSIAGVEALVRWNHPERGMILPADFVSVAEDNGLGLELGRWVLQTAISQLAEWADAVSDRFVMHVNVSPTELRQAGLCGFVAAQLDRYAVSAQALALEVSETGLMTGDVAGMDTLVELRALGVRIEIDDFGTGYSSISYLRDLPIQTVKVDRTLIMDIENDEKQRRMAGAIFQLIDAVGLDSIVEGVETEGQLSCLIQVGYQLAQGFLFAPGLDVHEMTMLLTGDLYPFRLAAMTPVDGVPQVGRRPSRSGTVTQVGP